MINYHEHIVSRNDSTLLVTWDPEDEEWVMVQVLDIKWTLTRKSYLVVTKVGSLSWCSEDSDLHILSAMQDAGNVSVDNSNPLLVSSVSGCQPHTQPGSCPALENSKIFYLSSPILHLLTRSQSLALGVMGTQWSLFQTLQWQIWCPPDVFTHSNCCWLRE